MTLPFRVDATDIEALDDLQLTQLLQDLLRAECFEFGIAQRKVEVSLNITIGDGGEDGRISWDGALPSTDFIPNRLTLFQNKASKLGPADCAKEVVKEGIVKARIDDVFENGGDYVIFTTQSLNRAQKEARETKIRDVLKGAGKAYWNSCGIWIYDAGQIANWANNFISTVVSVRHWRGNPMERGLKSFEQWRKNGDLSLFEFVDVPSRKHHIETLIQGLKAPKSCFRVQGLSGLGKTRMAMQVFEDDESLQSLVVYTDASFQQPLAGLVSDWVAHGFRAILVVDNCEYDLHHRLVSEVTSQDSKLSLLTLDYNKEHIGAPTQCIELEPMGDGEVIQLLKPMYQDQLPDLDRIASFAQGFPQMAVLLAKARLNDDPRVGELTEDALANKLLWKRDEVVNPEYEEILRVCALFDSFGVDEEGEQQLEFISSLVGANIDRVYGCIQKYSQRGIIDRRGRFGQLVPKPLAIRLAAQWWSETRPQKQRAVIQELPDEMVGPFCKQISRMDFHPNVKRLTEDLCGVQGPFGHAEVILSNRGSQLFRAFAEVNPESTTSTLYSILKELEQHTIVSISGDVRRNLVWALEKLCFRDEQFMQAAWCMMLLAVGENESWSNNASGVFSQLFRVMLSGTEAAPDKRLALINDALELRDDRTDEVILSALKEAISLHGGTRTVGAEYHGSQAPLEEWKPKVWQEIFDYWDAVFDILLIMLERGQSQKEIAIKVIGEAIRGLVMRGRLSMLDKAIKRVIELNGLYWPEALRGISNTLEYEGPKLPAEGTQKLREWLDLLSPDKAPIDEKIQIVVVNPVSEFTKDEDGHYVDKASERAKELAGELSNDLNLLAENLSLLSEGVQKQSFAFGFELAKSTEEIDAFLSESLAALGSAEQPNPQFALGLFSGIATVSQSQWERYIELVEKSDTLSRYYPDFITTGSYTSDHLQRLIRLVEIGAVAPVSVANRAGALRVTSKLSPKALADFCQKLSQLGDEASWAALSVVHAFSYKNEEVFAQLHNCVRKVVLQVPIGRLEARRNQMDLYNWDDLVKRLLKDGDSSFAGSVADQILSASKDGYEYGELWDYIKPMFIRLMTDYAEVVWPKTIQALDSTAVEERYWLKSLIDRETSLAHQLPSAFSVVPTEKVMQWCDQKPETAPVLLASTINIIDEDAEGNKHPSTLFLELLKRFGNKKTVRNNLFANLGSRSWSGSLVPILEEEKAILGPLKNHRNKNVKNWAKQYLNQVDKAITVESKRDEERDLGLF
ncbi:hypothetical protein [Marinobacter lipolyticus]|uniref:hypothetical protein n=1 Tax=Marinobacter lipolyticus TaxID=209639 RepID=UPI003A8FC848